MRLAEFALNLLDLNPEKSLVQYPPSMAELEKTISDSLAEGTDSAVAAQPLPDSASPYSVATRMGKSNYEEVAKAEALLLALKKMRAKNANGLKSTRVIRST
jgi:hypothetical protein